jgi:hypothetical protein
MAYIADADIDGIFAMGHLPIVHWLEAGKNIILKHPVSVYIGMSGGIPFYLVTDLSAEGFKPLLFMFFHEEPPLSVGVENGWIGIGMDSVAECRCMRASSFIGFARNCEINSQFISNFFTFSRPHLVNKNEPEIFCGSDSE